MASLVTFPTVIGTVYIHKLTAPISCVHMRVKLSQLTTPLTTTFFPCTLDFQLENFTSPCRVYHHMEAICFAEWAWFSISDDTIDAGLAEVLSTAVCLVWLSSDKQTDRTLILLQLGRGQKLMLIATSI